MSFTKKLYFLIGFVVLGIVMLSGITALEIRKVHDAANYGNSNSMPSIEQLDVANSALLRMRIAVWQAIAADNPEQEQIAKQKIGELQKQVEGALAIYEKQYIDDAHDADLLKLDRDALSVYYQQRDAVIALADNGDGVGARAKQLAMQPIILKADKALVEHRAYNVKLSADNAALAETALSQATYLTLAIATVVAIVLAGCSIYLVRTLANALSQAVHIAESVAGGNLAVNIPPHGDDEAGRVLSAMSLMTTGLTKMVGQVKMSSGTISTAVSEIANGNMDLSSRTEQQASTLEETASSMEELASAVRQNDTHARHAKELAQGAAATAQDGMKIVHDVVTTMGEISVASNKVSEIISVIEGITFQTNILALNAAVEAARAGEQGRGFAVVATEVRSLAQRSAAAAKDIKHLIDHSVARVTAGNELATKAGDAMTRVVQSVDEVSVVISEISAASSEQTTGIEEVNDAVMQMDGVTQQNAALVEEAAAAAASMEEQAQLLADAVAVFKTHETYGASSGVQRPLAPANDRLRLAHAA